MSENIDRIAISSRIRLGRNVSGFNFFTKLRNEDDANFIIDSVSNAIKDFDDFDILRLKNLSLNECSALLERHLISKELIENKDISAVAISPDEHLFIMINEEDHIREQSIFDGFNLYKPYINIKKLDKLILDNLDISFSSKYGFLTSSPANLGTAMRASVMMFLPAIEANGDIEFVKKEARKSGFTVRGSYGEGSKNIGSFYQISNQNSLGMNEKEILQSVTEYVNSVIEMEISAREDILARNHDKLIDEIFRDYGILKECKLLDEKEMFALLSRLRFGAGLEFLEILDYKAFDRLFVEGCSANLKEIEIISQNMQENEVRSQYISRKVKELVQKFD